jgi:hypothetical protein
LPAFPAEDPDLLAACGPEPLGPGIDFVPFEFLFAVFVFLFPVFVFAVFAIYLRLYDF